MDTPTKIRPRPEKERPELCPADFCYCLSPDCPQHDFQRVANAEAVMYHLPTNTAFEIVYDPDHAMIGGITIFGFAARINDVYSTGQPPDDAEELAAIGRGAIIVFLNYAAGLF